MLSVAPDQQRPHLGGSLLEIFANSRPTQTRGPGQDGAPTSPRRFRCPPELRGAGLEPSQPCPLSPYLPPTPPNASQSHPPVNPQPPPAQSSSSVTGVASPPHLLADLPPPPDSSMAPTSPLKWELLPPSSPLQGRPGPSNYPVRALQLLRCAMCPPTTGLSPKSLPLPRCLPQLSAQQDLPRPLPTPLTSCLHPPGQHKPACPAPTFTRGTALPALGSSQQHLLQGAFPSPGQLPLLCATSFPVSLVTQSDSPSHRCPRDPGLLRAALCLVLCPSTAQEVVDELSQPESSSRLLPVKGSQAPDPEAGPDPRLRAHGEAVGVGSGRGREACISPSESSPLCVGGRVPARAQAAGTGCCRQAGKGSSDK